MQHLQVSGAVRHIYIYIYVIRRLKVKQIGVLFLKPFPHCKLHLFITAKALAIQVFL